MEIIKSDLENSLLYLKGSIPGSKNSVVLLRKSVKTFNRKTSAEKYAKNTSHKFNKKQKKLHLKQTKNHQKRNQKAKHENKKEVKK